MSGKLPTHRMFCKLVSDLLQPLLFFFLRRSISLLIASPGQITASRTPHLFNAKTLMRASVRSCPASSCGLFGSPLFQACKQEKRCLDLPGRGGQDQRSQVPSLQAGEEVLDKIRHSCRSRRLWVPSLLAGEEAFRRLLH